MEPCEFDGKFRYLRMKYLRMFVQIWLLCPAERQLPLSLAPLATLYNTLQHTNTPKHTANLVQQNGNYYVHKHHSAQCIFESMFASVFIFISELHRPSIKGTQLLFESNKSNHHHHKSCHTYECVMSNM